MCDARAADAERVREIAEQHPILTSAKVSEAEFKTRTECLLEGQGAMRTELVAAVERARADPAAARLQGVDMLHLERLEQKRRDDERAAGAVMLTNSSLSMAQMM